MNKRDLVLAALAPGKRASHTPVQVQKLLFLIDKEISDLIDGPYFDFQPYNYGPFDKAVYNVLFQLATEGLVQILNEWTWKSYRLTVPGQQLGEELLDSLSGNAKDYIQKVSDFVRILSFTQLVSAIYKAYPEMRANSVFQG